MAFKMKNQMLNKSAKGRSPMQSNYSSPMRDESKLFEAVDAGGELVKNPDGTYKKPVSEKGVKSPDLGDIKNKEARIAESKKRKTSHKKFFEENKALFTKEDGTLRRNDKGVLVTKGGKSVRDLNISGRTSSYIRSKDRQVDGKTVKGYQTVKKEKRKEASN